MSIKVMTWCWDHARCGGSDLLALLAIADHASDDGSNAWPSIPTIARKCRVDERTARRIVRRLEESKHLKVDVAGGPKGSNRYTVLMVTPGDAEKAATPDAVEAEAPAEQAKPPQRCAKHPGQYSKFCGLCRAERIGKDAA